MSSNLTVRLTKIQHSKQTREIFLIYKKSKKGIFAFQEANHFLISQTIKKSSALNTSKKRAYSLKHLLLFLAEIKRPALSMSYFDLITYRDVLQENMNTYSKKIEAEFRLSTAKKFLTFLDKNYLDREVCEENVFMDEKNKDIYTLSFQPSNLNEIKIAGIIDPHPQKPELTHEQIQLAFKDLEKYPMYQALAYFMLSSGLRLNEALQLKISDLPDNLQSITEHSFFCHRKHRHGLTEVKLLSNLLIDLKNFLTPIREEYKKEYEKRKKKNPRLKTKFSDHVFIKSTGNPIRSKEVQVLFAQIRTKHGVNFHSHALRTKKIGYDEKYAGISYAQNRANHRHPHTTMGYLSKTLQNQEIEIYKQLQLLVNPPQKGF